MAGKAFLVRQRVRHEYGIHDIPDPQAQYRATFSNHADAEALARRLTREELLARGGEFHLFDNGLAAASSLPEPVLRDWLEDAGIDLPDPVPRDPTNDDEEHEWELGRVWGEWWQCMAPPNGLLTPDQLLRVVEALDRQALAAYEVVEADAKTHAGRFAVVAKFWEWGDDWYYGSNDALVVYRTRAEAEAECARRTADRGDVSKTWMGGPNEFVVVELPPDAGEGA